MRAWMALLALLPACGGGGTSPPRQFGTIITVTLPDYPRVEQTWTANTDIDTDAKGVCDGSVSSIAIVGEAGNQDHKSEYCVISGKSMSIETGATLRAHGSKPLILLSSSTFNLQGTIDVSSKHDGTDPKSRGAGAMASCMGATQPTGNSGGFGGSFGGTGGNGGLVDAVMGGTAAPALPAFPPSLRGGCPGGDGSSTTPSPPPGAGGIGGGGVLIIAESLQINGTINASGAGGRGGPATKSGAGGGGSGGMIMIDVGPGSIMPGTGSIRLFANGGGGGQGGTETGLGAGAGDDGGESPDPMTSGAGGKNIGRSGGTGGIGSAGAKNDGAKAGNAINSGGGGGGGGAAGFIFTPPIAGALIAPLVTSPSA